MEVGKDARSGFLFSLVEQQENKKMYDLSQGTVEAGTHSGDAAL